MLIYKRSEFLKFKKFRFRFRTTTGHERSKADIASSSYALFISQNCYYEIAIQFRYSLEMKTKQKKMISSYFQIFSNIFRYFSLIFEYI